jgi:glutathione S-transferase
MLLAPCFAMSIALRRLFSRIQMQLIGMLDSPYVRRVAISLRLLGIPFEHRAISVFSTFEEFQRINPVVKAPTLICENGEALMDSTLILEYAQCLAAPGRSLMPKDRQALQHALHIIGLALAACEKSVQTVYERSLRPPEKHHQPWLDRVRGQVLAAYTMLEAEVRARPLILDRDGIDQAAVTTAVVWQFTQSMIAEIVVPSNYPALAAHSQAAEALPEFLAFPPAGPGVPSKLTSANEPGHRHQ